MFESLTDKLELTFKRLRGQGKISEKNIDDALREVRLALLEADVHIKVVKSFLDAVKAKAMGQDVLQSLTPEQQFIKVVRDELVALLGGELSEIDLKTAPPAVIMLVGLQGSGKTTTVAKLARYLKKEKQRSPYLVSADVYRPAAIDQLKILGKELDLPVYDSNPTTSPVAICRQALEEAKRKLCDVLLIDTAGRLHIDEELMQELSAIKDAVRPHQILFVADSMTGQDAVNQAMGFDSKLALSGIILTKLDGDARGGAALSIREMVGKPILFSGVGEKLDALEPFYPDRLASRILGMGDVLSLIDKVQQNVEQKEAQRLQQAFQKQQFTLEEFQLQLQQIKRMGSMGSLLEMIPGGKKLASQVDAEKAEQELKRVDAIINSMTRQERRNPALLNGSRRRRVAQGSGTTVTDINRLMKQFMEMKKMMQRVSKGGMRSLLGRMPNPFH
ncbi:MAG: signal recognition particle subunit [Candidatus Binatota bacterium]|jgi:signal recognition particle subunit SRP54|nr:signal recognition particle subunit [Candidatus Binatota bacterium]HMF48894.1 signal recognition particle protein [Candidatus Saccharimonadales bacterium]HTF94311.1 signal recognition particle protein [Verrucomicrobiae bacterium]